LCAAKHSERLRDGLVVAIAGPPNAGKSTLLNRIARRDVAIVSPIPGTTRDVIEVHLDLGGYPVTLLDTAGIRDSEDPIEQEGVRRARERAAGADLILWLQDAEQTSSNGAQMPSIRENVAGETKFAQNDVWIVRNKIDLVAPKEINERSDRIMISNNNIELKISALVGEGVSALLARLELHARDYFQAESGLITRERHRKALESAKNALSRALAEDPVGREDIIAEELRTAAQTLGRLTGRIDVEDVLDVIFRDFCIGK
jgi:tRNA modification GTPase